MTSHYRHRRIANPATGFPTTIEPGEIAANTANRQLAIGDAAPGSPGAPLILIAVRAFDARAQYAIGDFVVQGGQLYRAKVVVAPAAFNVSQWDVYSSEAILKQYADTGDAAVIAGYQSADTALQGQIDGKVAKTGDSMSGPLVLPGAPSADAQAATKKYVDDEIAAATGGAGATAADVSNVPAGNIAATNVQAALNELDNEKAPINSPALAGTPTAPTPAADDSSQKIANTAWFAGQGANDVPAPAGIGAPGTSLRFARSDHVHPLSSEGAPLDSPAFTGTPTAPTPPVNDNSTRLATTAFVLAQPVVAIANGIVTFVKMASSALATGPEFIANAANKILTANAVWAAAAPVTLNEITSTATPDFSIGIDFLWTLGGAGRTLANPVNLKLGQKGVIYLRQPAGGGATITTWGTAYKFPNNGVKPTLTANANALDVMTYIVKSATEIECTLIGNFA